MTKMMFKGIGNEMRTTGKSLRQILKERGIKITSDKDLLIAVKKVIKENPTAVNDYRKGKEAAIHFLFGKVMECTKGCAEEKKVMEFIKNDIVQSI